MRVFVRYRSLHAVPPKPGLQQRGRGQPARPPATPAPAAPCAHPRVPIPPGPLSLCPRVLSREVLASPAVSGQIKDTKAARETQALADFMAMLGQVGGLGAGGLGGRGVAW